MKKKEIKKPPPVVEDSDSSDMEQLLAISQKYNQRGRPKRPEKQEIPILKKVKPPEPPPPPSQPSQPPPPPPPQLPQLSSFKKSDNGAYKVPLHLHSKYPHAIRLYLGNLPDNFDKDHFHTYLRQLMEQYGACLEPGDPISAVQVQIGQKYCFVQFRSIEETDAAVQIDCLNYNGRTLKFKRVKDYEISPRLEGEREVPKVQPPQLQKLFVGGLAPDTDNDALARILGEYGNLKSLNVIRDVQGVCKGFAFCEFETDLEIQNCVNGLNNKVIGGRLLQVKKNTSFQQQSQDYIVDTITLGEQANFETKLSQLNQSKQLSNVVVINNAVRIKNIEDDYEYNFIVKDLRKEIEKIGRLLSIVVPRRKDGHQEGIGKVYVEFENEQFAKIAIILLQSKKYDGREIEIAFYDARLYADKLY